MYPIQAVSTKGLADRLSRMTIRRLMFVVVVIALSLEAFRLFQRSQHYGAIAESHAQRLQLTLQALKVLAEGQAKLPPAEVQSMTIEEERRAQYFLSLTDKYERAARFPWISVDPDPPPP